MAAPVIYGYARVSTSDQSPWSQVDALRVAGASMVLSDTISGATYPATRPGYGRLLAQLAADDVLVVTRLDRISRSLVPLLAAIAALATAGVALRSLAEQIDTTTAAGRLGLHMCCALAEFERGQLRERTLAGMASARARGVHTGRPRAIRERQARVIRQMETDGHTLADIARVFGVSRQTVRRVLSGQLPYGLAPDGNEAGTDR